MLTRLYADKVIALRQLGLPRDDEAALLAVLRAEEQAALAALLQEEKLREEAERRERLQAAYGAGAAQVTGRHAPPPSRPRTCQRRRKIRPKR